MKNILYLFAHKYQAKLRSGIPVEYREDDGTWREERPEEDEPVELTPTALKPS